MKECHEKIGTPVGGLRASKVGIGLFGDDGGRPQGLGIVITCGEVEFSFKMPLESVKQIEDSLAYFRTKFPGVIP